jgi:hypothetical protein
MLLRKGFEKATNIVSYIVFDSPTSPSDTVAEWLRRWIANPLLFERACSNHACVDEILVVPISLISCFRYPQEAADYFSMPKIVNHFQYSIGTIHSLLYVANSYPMRGLWKD